MKIILEDIVYTDEKDFTFNYLKDVIVLSEFMPTIYSGYPKNKAIRQDIIKNIGLDHVYVKKLWVSIPNLTRFKLTSEYNQAYPLIERLLVKYRLNFSNLFEPSYYDKINEVRKKVASILNEYYKKHVHKVSTYNRSKLEKEI